MFLVPEPLPKTRLFSVKEYDAMIEHGILTSNDRAELLNGVIIEKPRKSPQHASLNGKVGHFFETKLGMQVVVRHQNPVTLDEFSEPEPDVALVTLPCAKYFLQHPTAAEILLVIEISDNTLSLDRHAKAVAYARAGLPQYLLCNIPDRAIEDYRNPAPDYYRTKRTYFAGDSFNLVAFPDLDINAADLLLSK